MEKFKDDLRIRYQNCIDMRVAESQIQWERFNAMLVVNTIFIGLIGFTYSKEFNIPICIQLVLAPLGIVLCLLWLRMTNRGFMWVTFWTDKARQIEEENENDKFNPFMEGNKHKEVHEVTFNTRRASVTIIIMFIILYSIIFIDKVLPYICSCSKSL